MKVITNNPCAEIAIGTSSSFTTFTAIDAWHYNPIEAFCQTHSHEDILEYLDKDTIMDYAITHCSKLGRNLQGDE